MSNSLDPDQAQQNVGPDLYPKCLQMLSVDKKLFASIIYITAASKERVNFII